MGKNKRGIDPREETGNPAFNLKDAEPVGDWTNVRPVVDKAAAAVTEEDMALDRELERMSRAEEPPPISDLGPEPPPMKKTKETYTLLREVMDEYQPAKTLNELDEQVFDAKVNECDSVEATAKLVRYFVKDGSAEAVGYFMYKDIRVYIEGHFERSSAKDKETMEIRLHGAKSIA